MIQRTLSFNSFDEALTELNRLHSGDYVKNGRWDLAQTCDHLSYFILGSLDGHPYRVPWLIKVLFGRMVLRRILSQRKMKAGVFTPQKPLPAAGGDEPAAVVRLKVAIERLQAHQGDMQPSPFFGYLTPQQWRDLHLIHCAHHLGFLTPK